MAHAGPLRSALDRPELEPALARLWTDAQQTWPAIAVKADAFAQRLAESLVEQMPPDPWSALPTLFAGDLFLALGCAAGHAAAIAALETSYLVPATSALRGQRLSADLADEVRQALRVRLLFSEDSAPPRIATYGGRAPLLTWLRVAAARTAFNLRRAAGKEIPLDDPGAVATAFAVDPELDLLRSRHAGDFRAAFKAALAQLAPADGALLRLYYLEGLGTNQLAALYTTPRRSLQRRLLEIRGALLASTGRALAERLRLPASEVDSLMALIDGDPDTTFIRLLRDRGET